MTNRFRKDPDAKKDYHFDWTDWLVGSDTIADFETFPSAELTVEDESEAGGIVTVWVSGGTEGAIHAVTCRITTAEGRIDDKTMYFEMKSE